MIAIYFQSFPWRLQPLTCYSGCITPRCSLMSQMITSQLLLHVHSLRDTHPSPGLSENDNSNFRTLPPFLIKDKTSVSRKPFCSQDFSKCGLSMCPPHCTHDTEQRLVHVPLHSRHRAKHVHIPLRARHGSQQLMMLPQL